MNNVAEVESRAELVRAMPRCSNVSKKYRTKYGDSQCVTELCPDRDATIGQFDKTCHLLY